MRRGTASEDELEVKLLKLKLQGYLGVFHRVRTTEYNHGTYDSHVLNAFGMNNDDLKVAEGNWERIQKVAKKLDNSKIPADAIASAEMREFGRAVLIL